MIASGIKARRNQNPLADLSLPGWTVVALDGAIAAGAIRWTELDRLTGDQLVELARRIVAAQLVKDVRS